MIDAVGVAGELMDVTTALRRVVRRRLRATADVPPLPAAQLELLHVVADHPGIGVSGAAARLHLAGNTVSTLVNQLVVDGRLRRGVDPVDRRAVRLELTDAARARMRSWRSRRADFVGERLRDLPAKDAAKIAAALPALRRLLDSVEEEPPSETGHGG
jgi:DNA-binding MarR family transcriptional regulator